ncbi:MAG TPA: DoxX family protein [Bacteroidales bacterium]|nr:DoxX family protein [Bacteroidales bacterium]
MKAIRNISRIFVGLVFLFSGFVKAVDPWGTAIKFNDYFFAMGLEALVPYTFILGVIMIAAEFVIGFSLLTCVKVKLASLGALIFMAIFTPVTLWLALKNPVSDCGCFGDAIKLTNWQTFFKNIIIIIPTILIFWQAKKFNSRFSGIMQWNIAGVGILIVGFIMWYSYVHLPIIDFLPYKEGTHLPDLMKAPKDAPKDEYAQMITLKDTTTGKQIEIDVNTYTVDSTYWGAGTKYKYISISEPKLIKKGYTPPIHDFNIYDNENNNYIDTALNSNSYVFIFISPKLEKASNKNIENISALYNYAIKNNYLFYALTSSMQKDIDTFIVHNKIPFSFYMCDETTLKSIVRSNPGLMLLKNGTILKKWSYFDFPNVTDIEKITLNNK